LLAAVSMYDRSSVAMSLLMLDIDHFKQINDRHGHGVGDEVLRAVGETVRSCCRPSDTAARFGGDEFGVILGQTDHSGGVVVAERLLAAIRELRIPIEAGEVTLTCSAGLASSSLLAADFQPADILKAADRALYCAKQQGRDLLMVAS
jgi:diguanylate cyclase (GGDEF)-like protein